MKHCIVVNIDTLNKQIIQMYASAPYGTNCFKYEEEHHVIIVSDRNIDKKELDEKEITYTELIPNYTEETIRSLNDKYSIDFALECLPNMIKIYKELNIVVIKLL